MTGKDGGEGRARTGSETKARVGTGLGAGASAGGEDEGRFGREFGFETGRRRVLEGLGVGGTGGKTGARHCEYEIS